MVGEVMQGIFAEAALMLKFKHPCFPTLHDVFVTDRMQASICYEYGSNNVPLVELMNRWSKTGMPVDHVRRLIYQLLKAIEHLHSNKLVHQNICPQVITLQADGLLKLRGLSSAAQQSKIRGASIRLPPNIKYAPPEVLVGDVSGTPGDIWAIGCICGELITGQPIFGGKGEPGQIRTIASNVGLSTRQLSMINDRKDHAKILSGISHHGFETHFLLRKDIKDLKDKMGAVAGDLVDFFRLCFEAEPNKRATVEQLLNSRFIRDASRECRAQLADAEELARVHGADRARAARLSSAFMRLTDELTSCGCDIAAAAASIGMNAPNMPPGSKSHISPTPLGYERMYRGSGVAPLVDPRMGMGMGMGPSASAGGMRMLSRFASDNNRLAGPPGASFAAGPPFASGGSFSTGPSPWAGGYETAMLTAGSPSALSKTGAELLAGPPPSVPWAKNQPQGRGLQSSQGSRMMQSWNSMGAQPPRDGQPPREVNDKSSFVRRFVPVDRMSEFVDPRASRGVEPRETPPLPLVNEFGDELDPLDLQMEEESKKKSKAFVSGWLNQVETTPNSRRPASRDSGSINVRSSIPSDWQPQRLAFALNTSEGASNQFNQSFSSNPGQRMPHPEGTGNNFNQSFSSNAGQGSLLSRPLLAPGTSSMLPKPQWSPGAGPSHPSPSILDAEHSARSTLGATTSASVLLGTFNAFAARPSILSQEPSRVARVSNEHELPAAPPSGLRSSLSKIQSFTQSQPPPMGDALPVIFSSDTPRFKLNLSGLSSLQQGGNESLNQSLGREGQAGEDPSLTAAAKPQQTISIPWLQSHAKATIALAPLEPFQLNLEPHKQGIEAVQPPAPPSIIRAPIVEPPADSSRVYFSSQPPEVNVLYRDATREEEVTTQGLNPQGSFYAKSQDFRPLSAIYEQELEGPSRPATAQPPMDRAISGADLPMDKENQEEEEEEASGQVSELRIRAPSENTLDFVEGKVEEDFTLAEPDASALEIVKSTSRPPSGYIYQPASPDVAPEIVRPTSRPPSGYIYQPASPDVSPQDPEPSYDAQMGHTTNSVDLPSYEDQDETTLAAPLSDANVRSPSAAHTLGLIENINRGDYASEATEVRPYPPLSPPKVMPQPSYQDSFVSYDEEADEELAIKEVPVANPVADPVVKAPDLPIAKKAPSGLSSFLSPPNSRDRSPVVNKKSVNNPYTSTGKAMPPTKRLSSSGGGALQATGATIRSPRPSIGSGIKSRVSEVNGSILDSPSSTGSLSGGNKLPSLSSKAPVPPEKEKTTRKAGLDTGASFSRKARLST